MLLSLLGWSISHCLEWHFGTNIGGRTNCRRRYGGTICYGTSVTSGKLVDVDILAKTDGVPGWEKFSSMQGSGPEILK